MTNLWIQIYRLKFIVKQSSKNPVLYLENSFLHFEKVLGDITFQIGKCRHNKC